MTKRKPYVEAWSVNEGRWYWHLKAANGLVIADGSEGYATRSNALRAARRAKQIMAKAEIKDETSAPSRARRGK